MKKLVIYAVYIPKVGGIETALYEVAKALSNKYEITLVYGTVQTYESLIKYAEVANIQKIYGEDQVIECDVCLLSSNLDMPPQIKTKKLLQWIHSDYRKYELELKRNNVDVYIAVSKHAGRVAEQLFGIKPVIIQNIISPEFAMPNMKKVLKLVTNSRVSPEKGFGRMLKFAEGLKENGIDFQWTIYGDNTFMPQEFAEWKQKFAHIEEVLWVGYKSNITYGLAQADYLVQFSDFEGCPYSVLEALKVGVPCLLTNFDSACELVEDGKNGYLLPLTMQNIDYKKIATKIPKDFKFEQKGLVEKWEKVIEG